MDFWDLTRLLFRRWYIAAPVLILAVVAAGYVQVTVKPDYQSTSYVALIPPPAPPTDSKATDVPRNPWVDLGIDTLGTAVIHTIQDQSVLTRLKAEGFSTTFTITRDDYAPIYAIAVSAPTPAVALASVHQLATLFDSTVTSLQQTYGAPASRMFTTRRLDLGDNLTSSSTKKKRALVAIAAAGVLIAAGITIGIDAFLRRRRRRRASPADTMSTGQGSGDPSGPDPGRRVEFRVDNDSRSTVVLPAFNDASSRADARVPKDRDASSDRDGSDERVTRPALSDDATVVLQVPRDGWADDGDKPPPKVGGGRVR